jgi:hypothetical protein
VPPLAASLKDAPDIFTCRVLLLLAASRLLTHSQLPVDMQFFNN